MRPARLKRRLSDLVGGEIHYSWPGNSACPVAVASGKGGTGKSVLATNLAVALSKRDQRVLLVDADFGLGNVHLLLGVEPCSSVLDLLRNEKTVREVVHDYKGVKFIPGGSGIAELASLSKEQLQFLGRQLGSLEDESDIIIFDTPSGLNRHTLLILSACEEVIAVTTPDLTAITDTYALVKALCQHDFSSSLKIGVIVNRARNRRQARSIFNKMAKTAKRFLDKEVTYYGYVLDDEHVTRSAMNRRPVVSSYPGSPSGRCLLEIAGRLEWTSDGGINFSEKLEGILGRPSS